LLPLKGSNRGFIFKTLSERQSMGFFNRIGLGKQPIPPISPTEPLYEEKMIKNASSAKKLSPLENFDGKYVAKIGSIALGVLSTLGAGYWAYRHYGSNSLPMDHSTAIAFLGGIGIGCIPTFFYYLNGEAKTITLLDKLNQAKKETIVQVYEEILHYFNQIANKKRNLKDFEEKLIQAFVASIKKQSQDTLSEELSKKILSAYEILVKIDKTEADEIAKNSSFFLDTGEGIYYTAITLLDKLNKAKKETIVQVYEDIQRYLDQMPNKKGHLKDFEKKLIQAFIASIKNQMQDTLFEELSIKILSAYEILSKIDEKIASEIAKNSPFFLDNGAGGYYTAISLLDKLNKTKKETIVQVYEDILRYLDQMANTKNHPKNFEKKLIQAFVASIKNQMHASLSEELSIKILSAYKILLNIDKKEADEIAKNNPFFLDTGEGVYDTAITLLAKLNQAKKTTIVQVYEDVLRYLEQMPNKKSDLKDFEKKLIQALVASIKNQIHDSLSEELSIKILSAYKILLNIDKKEALEIAKHSLLFLIDSHSLDLAEIIQIYKEGRYNSNEDSTLKKCCKAIVDLALIHSKSELIIDCIKNAINLSETSTINAFLVSCASLNNDHKEFQKKILDIFAEFLLNLRKKYILDKKSQKVALEMHINNAIYAFMDAKNYEMIKDLFSIFLEDGEISSKISKNCVLFQNEELTKFICESYIHLLNESQQMQSSVSKNVMQIEKTGNVYITIKNYLNCIHNTKKNFDNNQIELISALKESIKRQFGHRLNNLTTIWDSINSAFEVLIKIDKNSAIEITETCFVIMNDGQYLNLIEIARLYQDYNKFFESFPDNEKDDYKEIVRQALASDFKLDLMMNCINNARTSTDYNKYKGSFSFLCELEEKFLLQFLETFASLKYEEYETFQTNVISGLSKIFEDSDNSQKVLQILDSIIKTKNYDMVYAIFRRYAYMDVLYNEMLKHVAVILKINSPDTLNKITKLSQDRKEAVKLKTTKKPEDKNIVSASFHYVTQTTNVLYNQYNQYANYISEQLNSSTGEREDPEKIEEKKQEIFDEFMTGFVERDDSKKQIRS
jgi:hypothetical protein